MNCNYHTQDGTNCHCSKGYHVNGTECVDENECYEKNDCHEDAICSIKFSRNGQVQTEFCDFTYREFNCTEQDSSLLYYDSPPLLFKVEKSLGEKVYDMCLPKKKAECHFLFIKHNQINFEIIEIR